MKTISGSGNLSILEWANLSILERANLSILERAKAHQPGESADAVVGRF